jgi:hypothetical protein
MVTRIRLILLAALALLPAAAATAQKVASSGCCPGPCCK